MNPTLVAQVLAELESRYGVTERSWLRFDVVLWFEQARDGGLSIYFAAGPREGKGWVAMRCDLSASGWSSEPVMLLEGASQAAAEYAIRAGRTTPVVDA